MRPEVARAILELASGGYNREAKANEVLLALSFVALGMGVRRMLGLERIPVDERLLAEVRWRMSP